MELTKAEQIEIMCGRITTQASNNKGGATFTTLNIKAVAAILVKMDEEITIIKKRLGNGLL